MRKKPSTNKTTSQKRCKGKGVTTPVERNKAAKGNNNSSVVTSERGSSSTAYHSNPADHPLFGVRRYIHKNHNSSDPVLHVNVTDHLSYKNTLTHIKGCGNNTLCGLWYRHELPPRVKEKVDSVGFSNFAILLGTKGRRDKHLLMALAERWWDTTHTFHLDEVGELTMTPKDFSAITGLPVCGKSLEYDMEAHTKIEEVVRLFGDPIRSILNAKMKCRDIVNKYKRWKPQTPEQEDQLTRVFILAVLGSSLCNDKSDSVYLYYMPSLAKIEEIKDYNRGGAGLACLYLSMDALSRGLVASTGGYWQAWEVSHFMLVDLMIITIACDVVMLLS
ncbi:protein MAINTENANCE OF MERISTEMS-like [Prunus dulcis]|uniref:protein MAINTENANCE OF MERISTEMS-like n=1 Tax=Prunus dulcis TaxID=3755 RepID=UPI0014834E2D|nr:protein MAINTENANCE OF MERISTEMS-like [Prunus dulcis]